MKTLSLNEALFHPIKSGFIIAGLAIERLKKENLIDPAIDVVVTAVMLPLIAIARTIEFIGDVRDRMSIGLE